MSVHQSQDSAFARTVRFATRDATLLATSTVTPARAFGLAVMVMISCASGVLLAQPQAPAISLARLRVQAVESCATRATLEARIRERTSRIQLVDDATATTDLQVTLQMLGTRSVSADLVVESAAARRSQRHLNAESCDAAQDALALLIAMALDPRLSTQSRDAQPWLEPLAGLPTSSSVATPPRPSDAAASTPSDAPVSEPSAKTTRSDAVPESSTPRATISGRPPAQSSVPNESGPEPFGFAHAGIGVGAQLAWGPAPHVMKGVSVTVHVALNPYGVLAPWLQLRAAHLGLSDVAERGGVAAFRLDLFTFDPCFIGLRASLLTIRGCGSVTVGRVFVAGSDTYAPQSHSRLWSSWGGGLLLTFDLVAGLQLQAAGGLTWPMRRIQVAFAPEIFYRTQRPCWDARLALAVRFP